MISFQFSLLLNIFNSPGKSLMNRKCNFFSICVPLSVDVTFQAMKVENMVRLKEEFDYKSMCRRLEIELDKLIAENERQHKDFEDELERIKVEAQNRVSEAEQNYSTALEVLCPLTSISYAFFYSIVEFFIKMIQLYC